MSLFNLFSFLERDYRKEYDTYQGLPKQKKRRAQRNSARRKMIAQGKAKKGDGKDVDHIDRDTDNNANSNLRVISRSKNRARNG